MNQIARKMSIDELSIISIKIEQDQFTAEISDGRTVSVPFAWFSRLASASEDELKDFEISPAGYGVHWPRLDEDISIKSILR
ncbi:MAG: DUF2442 domain-containing protein [Bdellovibrionota bacterium]